MRFIRRAKELGFTLTEIKSLLSLRLEPTSTAANVKHRVEEKVAQIEAKIHSLRRIKKALEQLTESCPGHGPLGDCPILQAFEGRASKGRIPREWKNEGD